MEVASPLSFPHGQAGTKRPYAFAPTAAEEAMDHEVHDSSTDAFGHQSKRRRREERIEPSSTASSSTSAFPAFATSPSLGSFATPSKAAAAAAASSSHAGSSLKRGRADVLQETVGSVGSSWNQQQAQQKVVDDLRRLVDHQSSEIDRLTSEKEQVINQRSAIQSEHDRVASENKILKRAVAIQQERQNHAAAEIDAARRYKDEADERIRRLEQMNLALQYRLQAQEPCAGNDFMGFSPRPPDVF